MSILRYWLFRSQAKFTGISRADATDNEYIEADCVFEHTDDR